MSDAGMITPAFATGMALLQIAGYALMFGWMRARDYRLALVLFSLFAVASTFVHYWTGFWTFGVLTA